MTDEQDRSELFAGNDPFAIAKRWQEEAWDSEPNDANAIALATADAGGLPNVRMVLLKEIEDAASAGGPGGGFVFYTNHDSAKGEDLAANPQAAFVMHWKSLRRQVRARGRVEHVSAEQSDAYYNSRHLQSRIGAHASKQSRPLGGRAQLVKEAGLVAARYPLNPPRPENWGGFRILPVEIEFWADGAFRLHDRFRWTRETPDSDAWSVQRLYP